MLSREDFDIMVNELLGEGNPCCFDMLCRIADRTLRGKVRSWCVEQSIANMGFEDDVMQDVFLKLMKNTVTRFLLRDPEKGVNYDPEGFEDWMFTVAHNTVRDYAAKVRRIENKNKPVEDGELESIPDTPARDDAEETSILSEAFAIVLDADVSVYKTLTWLAQSVFMLSVDLRRVDAGKTIVELFQDKTLYQMRDMIIYASRDIKWLTFNEEQREKVNASLNEPYGDGRAVGEVKYSEFFMKKGGKYSVSDWVNRMNGIIKRVMEKNEAFNN